MDLSSVIRRSIEKRGVTETARRLGLSVEPVVRLAGGIKVQRGTEAQVRERLHLIEDSAVVRALPDGPLPRSA
jgi:hypothetical protein